MQMKLFEEPESRCPLFIMGGVVSTEYPAPAPRPEPDPTALRFEDFRRRSIFGLDGKIKNMALLRAPFPFTVQQLENQYPNGEDPRFGNWDEAVEAGRSYLVGNDTPLAAFLKRYSSEMNEWQKLAYAWVMANPGSRLVLKSTQPRREFHIYKRGEYVEIGLPHQDAGGEKHWISRDGKRKVLVNQD